MKFTKLSSAVSGNTPGMQWVITGDGKRGLLKPDRDGDDLVRENEFEAVASYFGLRVSP